MKRNIFDELGIKSQLLRVAILAGVAYLVYRFLMGWIPDRLKEVRRSNTIAKDGKNNEQNASGETVDKNTVAALFRAGMNPSGYPSLFHVDGTDEEQVFKAAEMSAGIFSEIAKVYAALYNGDRLLEDLTGELDSVEMEKVRQLARLSGARTLKGYMYYLHGYAKYLSSVSNVSSAASASSADAMQQQKKLIRLS